MLRFNTFRAKRYLRSKFVEGKYLLASEATDLELEILDVLRKTVQNTLGSAVAVEDAWKVSKLSANQILIQPGEAWVKGLPFSFREGKDQLVSGAILSLGTVPVGVTISDEPNGLGKIIEFNDGATTPTNSYRVSVVATEELITDVDDPFLKNVNLTETTAQKIRLLFKLNIVPVSLQADSPLPYRDETSTAVSPTNFPNVGGFASPNLKNQVVVNPTAAGNGELISLSIITGSEGIDGRDLQLVVRNNPALGGGQPFPQSPLGQSSFANGTLIDSNGNSFYVNAIFNDTVSTQLVIRIDKEPDQPNPEIINGKPYTLIKREVFVTDDVNGAPQGRLYWDLADITFNTTNGIVHESSVTDLREVMSKTQYYQDVVNQKFDLQIVDGGIVSFDAATSLFTWSAPIRLINPHGAVQTIAAGSARVVDGGSLHYLLNLSGGAIQKGTQAITVTAFGATSTLSPLSLAAVALGNIVVDSAGQVAQITAIDDVNNTITTSPALTANGAGTIYMDSYGPGMAPLSERSFVLAARSGTNIYVGGQEIQDGESGEIGDGITQQLLDFIGSTSETDDSPNYTSENYVSDGDSLVTAISALDLALFALSGAVDAISWKAPVANFAALPLMGNADGDVRLVLDTRIAYHWTSATSDWKPLTGTGGGIKVIGGGTLSVGTISSESVYNTFGTPGTGDFSYTLTAANHKAATRIVIGNDSPDISSLRLSLRKVGTPTGNLRINLYSATGTTVDTLLQQSQPYSIASLTTSYGWIQLDLLTPFNNAPSDDYYAVVELDGGASVSVGDYIEIEGLNSIPAPAPAVSSKYNGTTWVDSNSQPLFVTVYENGGALLGGQQLLNANNFAIVPNSEAGSAFVAQNTGELSTLAVKIDIGLASIVSYTAKLYATAGGLPTGASLATSTNSFTQTDMSPSGTPTDLVFTFAPGTILNSGTTYAWSVDMTGNNSSFFRTANTNVAGVENVDDTSGWQLSINQNSIYFDLQLAASSDIILSFTDDMYLEKAGLAYTDNTIDVSESPIAFAADFDVAYVLPNLLSGGPALTVIVDTLDQVPLNAVIIARREGSDIIVGSSSTRLKLGQSTELYAQESHQSRNTLRSVDFLRANDPVTWTGTQLQFTSNIILESLNSRLGTTKLSTILASNSPLAMADGDVCYVVIDRATASGNVTPVVSATMPTVSSENEEIIVLFKRIDANGAGYLHIPLHKQVLEPGQTVRLGASGSGSGSGNEILETLKNHFIDTPFELLTPSIFSTQADDLVDGTSTGAYTLVDKTFTFDNIGDTLVSTQLLDPTEFLLSPESINFAEFYVFWNMAAIDPNATYEISRNGGNEWQAVDMERVGTTEAFRGFHEFSVEGSNQTLFSEAAVSGTDALNATSIQELAQSFSLIGASEIRSIELLLNKAAAAQGKLYVQIRSDDGLGSPSNTVIAESSAIDINALSTGNITVTAPMNVVLDSETYHVVLRTDATYKAGGFNLAWRRGTGSEGRSYNGTAWTTTSFDYGMNLLGIEYDLRIRITSSTAGAKLDGYGVYYKKPAGEIVSGVKQLEVFKVDGSANVTNFVINNFTVNPDQLKVYDVNSGKVYRFGVFTLAGNTVQFDSGQFYSPGETITLVFDQSSGSAYDNSDLNALLLASNNLGSTDAGIDKSNPGRGIFLRRPDGTLREVAIDNNDNIVIYSV